VRTILPVAVWLSTAINLMGRCGVLSDPRNFALPAPGIQMQYLSTTGSGQHKIGNYGYRLPVLHQLPVARDSQRNKHLPRLQWCPSYRVPLMRNKLATTRTAFVSINNKHFNMKLKPNYMQ